MDKATIVENQMQQIAIIGNTFYNTVQKAKLNNVKQIFISDASELISLLSGSPDAGAIQVMKDSNRDVASTRQFLEKWRGFNNISHYSQVLNIGEELFIAIKELNNTLNNLTKAEKSDIENIARIGRLGRLLRKFKLF